MRPYLFLLLSGFFALACNDDFVPLKKGYPRIELPKKHSYRAFDSAGFPYSFQIPTYAVMEKDSEANVKERDARYWMNLVFPSLNATIHLTYKPLGKQFNLDQLIYEAFKLTNKQVYKATGIHRKTLHTEKGYKGILFKVDGDAATAYQFFLTDEKKHFLRGALYFNATPNEDSLQKATDFIFKDMEQLVNSTQFN